MALCAAATSCAFAQDDLPVPPDEPRSVITEAMFNSYVFGNGPVLVLRIAPAAIKKAQPAKADAPRVEVGPQPVKVELAPVEKNAPPTPVRVEIQAAPDVPFREVQAAIQQVQQDAPPGVAPLVRLTQPAASTTGASPAKARAQFSAALEQEIRAIDGYCELSDAQRKKLDLAGRGDIKQFFDRAEDLRTAYVGPPLTRIERTNALNEMQKHGTALRTGLLHDDSLFRKTIRQTLTDMQLPGYASLLRDREVTMVEKVLVEWDQRALDISLSTDSRKKLAQLLVDHSNPVAAAKEYWVTTLQIAALKEDDVRPLFAAAEWPILQRELQEARELEPTLRQRRLWPIPARIEREEMP